MSDSKNTGRPQTRMETVFPGIHTHMALGNDISIETDRGVVQIDTGLSPQMAKNILRQLRERTQAPVDTIIYSHGHNGHNTGATTFLEAAEERGEPRPRIVAHERLPARWRRYQETFALQNMMAAVQFRVPPGYPAIADVFLYPDITFKDIIRLDMGNRLIEVLSAPSETDDSIAVWLPEERVLYAGPAFINACPNPGTPYRTFRDPVRWAETLDRFISLRPAFLIPPNGPPIEGEDEICRLFSTTAQALRYIRQEVVKRMNDGLTDVEILHDITYPPELFDLPWMNPAYGCPDYIVREVYRSENGWWDRNPTSLHPAHPNEVSAAVLEAITDRAAVLDKAQALRDAGQVQLALHVIDLLALVSSDDEDVIKARRLKAELLQERAKDVPSFVSTNLFLSNADRLKEQD